MAIQHGANRWTPQQCRNMRKAYHRGVSQQQLRKQYRISAGRLHKILKGWR